MNITLLQQTDIKKLPFVQPPTWYDIRPIHKFYLEAPYCETYKIEINGELVSVGTVIFHDDVAWLAHILVHENHRKKGLGRSISKHILDVALNKGIKTIYLKATDMGAPVYAKLGFEVETEYLIYKEFNTEQLEVESEHIYPYSDEFKQDILDLDKRISGENRIDNLCLYLKTGFVYQKNNMIYGFYLPDFGEGLIVAKEKEAGICLLKKRMKEKDTVLFPKENLNAQAFMKTLDIQSTGTIRRMIYGEKRPLDLSSIYNRIGGNLG